jgi:RNA-directed DNA polymerase
VAGAPPEPGNAAAIPSPDTFLLLGFTHFCATSRTRRFKLKRTTSKKRMRAKLESVKNEMRRRMHPPIPE